MSYFQNDKDEAAIQAFGNILFVTGLTMLGGMVAGMIGTILYLAGWAAATAIGAMISPEATGYSAAALDTLSMALV